MADKKILVILSEADHMVVKKKDGTTAQEPAGIFLTELTTPLFHVLDAGYDVVFASPTGKGVTWDSLSQSLAAYMGNWFARNKDLKLVSRFETEKNFKAPRPFASLTDEELASFGGVFIPGGHAPITDLGTNPELGRLLYHFHNASKPTAIICHGPYALLSTKHAPDSPGFAYEGYNLTSWSDAEEGLKDITLSGKIVNRVQGDLNTAGAVANSTAWNKLGSIVVDREVVSGANPLSANALGTKFVEMLKARA